MSEQERNDAPLEADALQTDSLQKFLFENNPVRGVLVDLSASWRHVQERHEYPVVVQTMLGEMLAACALLSANLKFEGTIIMQIHGDGPVKLLVAESCTSADGPMKIRATAKMSEQAVLAGNESLQALVNVNGQGRFIITLDPENKLPGQNPYQGIVPLDGEEISTAIENYMMRSEQLDTKLWLAADANVARGLLLQKLPGIGGTASTDAQQAQLSEAERSEHELEVWQHVVALASTLKRTEMLSTDINTLMRRLFWDEDLRVFAPQALQFHCTCTREKVGDMLRMLGADEVGEALKDLGSLNVNCQFCGMAYEFDAVDCAQLFIEQSASVQAAQDLKH